MMWLLYDLNTEMAKIPQHCKFWTNETAMACHCCLEHNEKLALHLKKYCYPYSVAKYTEQRKKGHIFLHVFQFKHNLFRYHEAFLLFDRIRLTDSLKPTLFESPQGKLDPL